MASRRIVLCVVLATSVLLIAGSASTFAGTEHGVTVHPSTAHPSDFEDETANGLECAPPPLSSAGDEPPTSAEGDRNDREARIVELYPNPTTHGNAGEYLVLEVQRDSPRELDGDGRSHDGNDSERDDRRPSCVQYRSRNHR